MKKYSPSIKNNNALKEANTEPKPSLVIEDTLEEVQLSIIEEDAPKEVIKEKKEEILRYNSLIRRSFSSFSIKLSNSFKSFSKA